MPNEGLLITDVDFTVPGSVDPADFGLDGLHSAAARLSVDLSPTSGLGESRLGEVRRGDGSAVSYKDSVWFSLSTPRGVGALVFDSPLAVAVADLLLGGKGNADARPLTSVEEKVMVPHLRRAIEPLSGVFAGTGVEPIDILGPGRGLLQLRGDTLSIDIVVETSASGPLGKLTIMVPSPPLASPGPGGSSPGARELGSSGVLTEVLLPLSVLTDVTVFPASAVKGMKSGDVVTLAHRSDAPLRILCGSVEIAKGTLGRHESTSTILVEHVHPRSLGSARRTRALTAVIRPAAQAAEQATPTAGSPTEGEADMSETPPEADAAVAAALAAAEEALEPPTLPPTATDVTPAFDLGLLADVPVEISVEVGRASISLRDAASLAPGQVVPLDSEAGSPATVLVNGRVVAKGQVVVVDEVYGVRISELVEE